MEIKIKKLTKVINGNIILDNINLNLKSGKIYGFIGRNGSGKTMLFNAICGFIIPTSGSIIIDGNNITDNHIFPNNVRALIENPKFISSLSGFKNLKLLASINNSISDDDINSTLKQLGLINQKNKLVSKYSLGMKQKLGIAQVLMENPDIMIFDEPFNGLDDNSVEKLKKILIEAKKNDKLILISTHIKEDFEKLCDEVYKLDDGKIVQ